MSHGLIIDDDQQIAAWATATFKLFPIPANRVLGVANREGKLVGCVLLQFFNGANIELSYYGYRTVSIGIVCSVARIILTEFNVSRVTVVVPKRNRQLCSSVQKLGWKLEGAMRCHYGHKDNWRNTGLRYVMFRDQIEKLAALDNVKSAATGV